jgi:hypothetical protein
MFSKKAHFASENFLLHIYFDNQQRIAKIKTLKA